MGLQTDGQYKRGMMQHIPTAGNVFYQPFSNCNSAAATRDTSKPPPLPPRNYKPQDISQRRVIVQNDMPHLNTTRVKSTTSEGELQFGGLDAGRTAIDVYQNKVYSYDTKIRQQNRIAANTSSRTHSNELQSHATQDEWHQHRNCNSVTQNPNGVGISLENSGQRTYHINDITTREVWSYKDTTEPITTKQTGDTFDNQKPLRCTRSQSETDFQKYTSVNQNTPHNNQCSSAQGVESLKSVKSDPCLIDADSLRAEYMDDMHSEQQRFPWESAHMLDELPTIDEDPDCSLDHE